MEIKQIITDLGDDWSGYREIMVSTLFNDNPLIAAINSYLTGNEGKQLRPILSLLAGGACGKRNRAVLNCAAVAEMIHTATLMHDDVTDNGNIRRGKPTVKALFSPAAAVLCGDYWLARALYLLCTGCSPEILECFTTAVEHLAEGEMIQMNLADTLQMTEEKYYEVISKKTSSLFIAATRSAAIAVNPPKEYIDAITRYALYLGQAFQIRDDIFDYSPDLQTGKAAGADVRERKITLPLIFAIKNSPAEEGAEIMKKIEGQSSDVAKSALDFVTAHNGIAAAQEKLAEKAALAKESIAHFPDSIEKRHLLDIAEYLCTCTC